MSFKFYSLRDGMPNTKEALHSLAFYAYYQYLSDGGEVTICRPAVAIGSGFSPNKHPRNGIVGARSPLTV